MNALELENEFSLVLFSAAVQRNECCLIQRAITNNMKSYYFEATKKKTF